MEILSSAAKIASSESLKFERENLCLREQIRSLEMQVKEIRSSEEKSKQLYEEQLKAIQANGKKQQIAIESEIYQLKSQIENKTSKVSEQNGIIKQFELSLENENKVFL